MCPRIERVVLIHADESCLGNGREGANPGGGGSLVETLSDGMIVRRDLLISSPDTTNNRMALSGAIATFKKLSEENGSSPIIFVSDSQYLVKGMNEWVAGWRARGWRRKGGEIENLILWKELVAVAREFSITWKWVRGHSGHPKNEYVDDLAVRAATDQLSTDGFVKSSLDTWLAHKQSRGQFISYDADRSLLESNGKLAREL
jgi:ribonuclease HI